MTKPVEADETVILDYDLHALPTAQHKSGLAGLLLMIESMRLRRIGPLPGFRISHNSVRLEVTKESLQALCDDFFDARWIETETKTKWQKAVPKRVIEKEEEANGKVRKTKFYVYDIYQPKGKFLEAFYQDGDGVWLKLWRDMLWNSLRGKPLTRLVYKERADGKPSTEAEKLWMALVESRKQRAKGAPKKAKISSALFIGAQDVNAENVPFKGEVEQNLLLLFWPLVSPIFAPRRLGADGRQDDAGFVIAIPEPSNLSDFVSDTTAYFRSLDTAVLGYRPKDALVDLPEEAAMEYLLRLVAAKLGATDVSYSVAAVEVYHIEKKGNSIRLKAANRIKPNPRLLKGYDSMRREARNPLYKQVRLTNMLADRPWYQGMEALFNTYPWTFFVRQQGKTPVQLPFFGHDAQRKFKAIEQEIANNELMRKGGAQVDELLADDKLSRRVFQLIQTYVNRKTEAKSGRKYEDFKTDKDENGRVRFPKEYRESRERVCSDAFLAIRGRREQDFVEYFTGTICSVPQWLPEEDFVAVSRALMQSWETIKTLSMLALSAASYTGSIYKEKGE